MFTLLPVPVRGLTIALTSLLVVQIAEAGKKSHLPGSIPLCSLKSPQLSECLRDSVLQAIPELVKGVPSLGVLPIDPLDILEADIGAADGPVALSVNFRKIKISNLRTVEIVSTTFDPKPFHIELKIKVNPLKLDGKYKMNGRVLVLPIQGDGNCLLVLHNLTADLHLYGKEVMKHGERYTDIERLDVTFNTTKLDMNFENLFNGNKQLGDNMNRFLNQNWEVILHELKPSIQTTFGETFRAIANRIFLRVPFSSIFLP